MNSSVFFRVVWIASVLLLPARAPKAEARTWSDERIDIRLDSVERTDRYPDELRLPGYRYKSAAKGDDFLIVRFTVTRIEGVHLGMPSKDSPSKPLLFDTRHREHDMLTIGYQSVEFKEGLKGGEYEIVVGAKGIMLFAIPEDAEPATLEFAYPYWQSWEEKKIEYGSIQIGLQEQSALKS